MRIHPLALAALTALTVGLWAAPQAPAAGNPNPAPDLQIAWWGDPPGRLDPGVDFQVAALIANRGTANAPSTRTRFTLTRTPRSVAPDDIVLASIRTPSLSRGRQIIRSARATIPADTPTGTYFVRTCVDATGKTRETRESNNCRVSSSYVFVPPTAPAAG